MSKPIDKTVIMKDACESCSCLTRSFLYFKCVKQDLGEFNEPCTKEDWAQCPFNKQARKPAVKKAPPQNYIADLEKFEFKNRGEFYYNANRYLDCTKKEIDPVILGLNLDDAAERKEAWLKLIKTNKLRDPGVEVNGR